MRPRAQESHVQLEIVACYSCALFIDQIYTENITTVRGDSPCRASLPRLIS